MNAAPANGDDPYGQLSSILEDRCSFQYIGI
jgi:hypothetical protein